MEADTGINKTWISRLGLFVIFAFCMLLIFVVFSHFRPLLPRGFDVAGRSALVTLFCCLSWYTHHKDRYTTYFPIFLAFFIATVALFLDLYLSRWMLWVFHVAPDTVPGIALDKLESTLMIVLPVILLTHRYGEGVGSIYLRRGNLKAWLAVGLVSFFFFAATALPTAENLFFGKDLTFTCILPWSLWILIFVFSNAFNEELLFRGLFLQKFEPLFGRFLTNVLVAVVFTLSHAEVKYTPDALIFLAILLPLALILGYIIQKTNSIWGAVLFHAGIDIPVIVGMYSNMN